MIRPNGFLSWNRALLVLAALTLLITLPAHAQLDRQIQAIAAEAHGKVGVSCALPGAFLRCDLAADTPLPMQSVYKLPIAITVLHQVEQGRFTLDQPIRFLPSDARATDWYSPLHDKYPEANVDIPLKELLRLAVSESDNSAADILFRILATPRSAGPETVSRYMAEIGLPAIHIRDNEMSMHLDQKLQYRNSSSARTLVQLLRLLADNSPINAADRALLETWMTDTPSGPQRIKAQLPPGTEVAHKTGSSDTVAGLTAATNDIALIKLPNGQQLALAILVSDSPAPDAVRESIIARIAAAIYASAVKSLPRP